MFQTFVVLLPWQFVAIFNIYKAFWKIEET